MFMQLDQFPRKPYKAKGSRVKRCSICVLAEEFCICDERQISQANVEFWLIMHRDETRKPTNTGRLIESVLPNQCRKYIWSRTEPDLDLIERLNSDQYLPHVIFPDDREGYEHRLISSPNRIAGKTPAFIILDGSWRQASRMFRHSKYLQHIPVLPVKSERESTYKLRKAPNAGNLCTAEVGIALLEMSDELHAASRLEQYYNTFNQSYSDSRRIEKAQS